MKKVFFAAAALLLMVCATSCEKGKCACVGYKTEASVVSGYDIMEEAAETGISNKEACDKLKDKYPDRYAITCEENKSLDDILN